MNKKSEKKLKLNLKKDIKPYFYIRGNYDLLRCTDNIKFNSVFDVGCGKGGASLYFANRGKDVTAITIGEEFHSYRKDWFSDFGIDVEIGDFAFYKTKKKYDAVWMSHSLEHTQLPGKFLENAWTMLNNDGWLFVLVPPYNHLLTNGHFSTGWNMGTLMYNLYISGFDIKNGHYARYGSNLCAFVQKNPKYKLEPGAYVSVADSASEWPVAVRHHSSLENLFDHNWFPSFSGKLKEEADKRKAIKKEENSITTNYSNVVLESALTANKFKLFAEENKGKTVVCYGAGFFAKSALAKYDFSSLNILGFVDKDVKKIGNEINGYKIYSINSINKEINPDIILMTCVKKMWGVHHVLPNEVKAGLGDTKIVHDVFSL
jgi:SAM-dependent methyltransferase